MSSMKELTQFLHVPVEILWGILAICGGVARYLNGVIEGRPFSIGVFFASVFISAFSGYMFALFGKTLQLGDMMVYMMAGLGGFFGEQTLKLIMESVSRRVATK